MQGNCTVSGSGAASTYQAPEPVRRTLRGEANAPKVLGPTGTWGEGGTVNTVSKFQEGAAGDVLDY